mgnify:CR=1 FL=1
MLLLPCLSFPYSSCSVRFGSSASVYWIGPEEENRLSVNQKIEWRWKEVGYWCTWVSIAFLHSPFGAVPYEFIERLFVKLNQCFPAYEFISLILHTTSEFNHFLPNNRLVLAFPSFDIHHCGKRQSRTFPVIYSIPYISYNSHVASQSCLQQRTSRSE